LDERKKQIIRETFDTVSSGYDHPALRFFTNSAEFLAKNLGLRGDEHVLDVACGTGNAAFALAPLLPNGRVTGIDFSSQMLEQARRKAASGNIGNVEFVEGDMQSLNTVADLFDAAVCSFGIFFVDDMDAQLARIAAAVRPGGAVAITGFHKTLFGPLTDLFMRRLDRYGIERPQLDWMNIATEESCRAFFARAGLRDIRTVSENMGYFLENAEGWWDVVWNAGFRRVVGAMEPDVLEKFRSEHLAEVDALQTDDGIWLDVVVLFTFGTKA